MANPDPQITALEKELEIQHQSANKYMVQARNRLSPLSDRMTAHAELGSVSSAIQERRAQLLIFGAAGEATALTGLASLKLLLPYLILGRLYSRAVLDIVVDTAGVVANDFAARPQSFKAVPSKIATLLVALRTKVGTDPDFPNAKQRQDMYQPIFGDVLKLADTSTFARGSGLVKQAASAYAERVFDTGEAMLRQAFLDKLALFHAYLTTTTGASVQEAFTRTTTIFEAAVDVLTDSAVARAYDGLPPASGPDWPFQSVPDGDGAVLLERIAGRSNAMAGVSVETFLRMQLLAFRGSESIGYATIYRTGVGAERAEAIAAITAAYSWATAAPTGVAPA